MSICQYVNIYRRFFCCPTYPAAVSRWVFVAKPMKRVAWTSSHDVRASKLTCDSGFLDGVWRGATRKTIPSAYTFSSRLFSLAPVSERGKGIFSRVTPSDMVLLISSPEL